MGSEDCTLVYFILAFLHGKGFRFSVTGQRLYWLTDAVTDD
jgi:hypothetical protein